MPMHDWTRVSAGTYHDFHSAWITHLKEALNSGLLPPAYYALAEQRAGDLAPDIMALHAHDVPPATDDSGTPAGPASGLVAVAEAPPRVRIWQEAADDVVFYAARQRSLVVRHTSGDRIIAVVEIVSPANKHSRTNVEKFVYKVTNLLAEGIHTVVIDPLPPGPHDPAGMHGEIWTSSGGDPYTAPDDLPLTLAAYCAKHPLTTYVEPLRVGQPLVDMPLFVSRTHYISMPLEATYQQAWSGVPLRWRRVIDETAG